MESLSQSRVQNTIRRRWRRSHSAVAWAIVILMLGAISGVAAEPDVSAIIARVQLLPLKDDAPPPVFDSEAISSPFAKGSPEGRARVAEAIAWAEASAARFTKWVRHEDELVSFLVPDDPRVRLEIRKPEDGISVEGDPLRSSGSSFFRCYRLTFRGKTYGLLLLDRQATFDDNICFCGHVAYEKYLQHHDALYRFSLLEDGKIKKIQILGEGLRLVVFEWTHVPIHQEVYEQIALSVRWRQPPRDLRALTAKIQQTYGKTGFLERGMDRGAVVAMLGPPTSEDRDLLRYVSRRSYEEPPGSVIEEVTWNIPLKDGRFLGLCPDWQKTRRLPPERNSVQWVLARLDGRQGDSDSVTLARDDELPPLLARVVELLPTVREEDYWWMLCRAVVLLAQSDVKDPRVPQIIKKRYLDPQLPAADASEALREYDSEGSQELFAKRIRLEMLLARKPEAMKDQADYADGWSSLEALFGYLRPEHPEREALILEAMDHPHAGVRMDGYKYCADLPDSTERPRLRKGLGDASAQIRMYSAGALTEMWASDAENAEDLARLHAQRAKERDENVVEALNQAIKRLE